MTYNCTICTPHHTSIRNTPPEKKRNPPLHPQHPLPTLPHRIAHRRHRHDLQVPNAQPHEEPAPAARGPHRPSRLVPAQPPVRAREAPDLHPPAHDLERVGDGLGERPRDGADCEVCERRGLGFGFGVWGGGGEEEGVEVAPAEEGGAGVRDHAGDGDGEAAVEFEDREAREEVFGGGWWCCERLRGRGRRQGRRERGDALVIYLRDGSYERGS